MFPTIALEFVNKLERPVYTQAVNKELNGIKEANNKLLEMYKKFV